MSEDRPKILYKYRSWDNDYHRRLLTHKEIYFASARDFNDPFDCVVAPDYNLLCPDEHITLIKKYLKEDNPNASEQDIDQMARKRYRTARLHDPDYHVQWRQRILEAKYRKFGVCTLSGVRNSILMWSHYADAHRGFCVGIDVDKLDQFCDDLAEKQSLGTDMQRVEYYPMYPKLKPSDLGNEEWVLKQLLVKFDHWSYEDEWRLILLGSSGQSVTLYEGIICEVILGCRMEPGVKTEVTRSLRDLQVKPKLWVTSPRDQSFILHFDEYDYDY